MDQPADRPPCLAEASTLDAACDAVLDWLGAAGFDLLSVYLLEDGRLRCRAARGYYQVVDGFFPDVGVIGRCVSGDVEVVVHDVSQDESFVAAVPGIVAEACVPVRHRGLAVGAVNLETRLALRADSLPRLRVAAASLEGWLDARGGLPEVPLTQRLARISLDVTATTDADSIVPVAVRGAAELSGMGTGLLARRGPDAAWSRYAEGPLARAVGEWDDEACATMASWVRAGTSSHLPGGSDAPLGYEWLVQADVRSLSVHPLVAGGEAFGLLVAAGPDPVPHDAGVGAALELLAGQTAAALRVAEAVAELRLRAVQDPLTGLGNAGAFAADLERLVQLGGTGLCLLLIDVDDFKRTNDTFGHLAGDGLLRDLAGALAAELRGDDTLYRVGGDEFAALVTVGHAADGLAVGERLVHAARTVRATVSVGAAPVRGGDATATREAADATLYAAKSAGRDCARASGGPASSSSPR